MSRVLVIGGAGDVGSLILPLLARHHDVAVADVRRPAGFEGEYVVADVRDAQSIEQACVGVDVLVYIAMGTKRDWGGIEWARDQFEVNVTGLYTALRCAAGQGVRRFVHASTGSIFKDYLADDLPRFGDAVDGYGLSKALAEMVCDAAVSEHSIRGISLRLIGPISDEEWHTYDDREHMDVMTAGSDVASAFLSAVDSTSSGYHTLMISGDYENRLIDSRPAEHLLGWRAQARRTQDTLREST